MTLSLALILAFVLSVLYAAFLALHDAGQWIRQELTWLTVVLGGGMTLGCIAAVDLHAARSARFEHGESGAR